MPQVMEHVCDVRAAASKHLAEVATKRKSGFCERPDGGGLVGDLCQGCGISGEMKTQAADTGERKLGADTKGRSKQHSL